MKLTEETIGEFLADYQLNVLKQNNNCLQDIIGATVAYVRAEIKTNPLNRISDDPFQIPESVKAAASYLVIEALQSRIPALRLSADQIRNADNARKLFRRIARGEFIVSTQMANRTANIVSSKRERFATREFLRGL